MGNLTPAALKVAQSQVGQMENPLGSNWGHPVEDYLASVDIHEPASYCMAGMYWCFDQAAKALSMVNPLTQTGLVAHAWQVAYPFHKSTNIEGFKPQAGDIFIMIFGNTSHGHTGMVEIVNEDGSLGTIEFNTDTTGSPEGIGVFRRTRHFVPPIVGFLRYFE